MIKNKLVLVVTALVKNTDKISVRVAVHDDEVRKAQELRYEVFYNEYGAKASIDIASQKRDFDQYDPVATHLIVVDETNPDSEKIVGTYRLLLEEDAKKLGAFYSSDEYHLDGLLEQGGRILELGRSCVLKEYRTRPVLQLLWEGIAEFISTHNIDLMFGCASFNTTNIDDIAEPLSYLYHYHLTPAPLQPKALEKRYIDMNIKEKDSFDPKKAFAALPALIKGYLRVGATIGDGAVIDHQFNTTDVCIVFQSHELAGRYRKHYERRINKAIPGHEKNEDLGHASNNDPCIGYKP